MQNYHPTEVIGQPALTELKEKARQSDRRRAALQIHREHSDPVQRVLMAANPDSYVCPHRHPDKAWEMILLVEGALDILLFSVDGTVEQRISLSEVGNRICEYPADQFHASVILAPDTLAFEVKDGPYIADTAKAYPDWAPEEQSAAASSFHDRMRKIECGGKLSL